MYTHPLMNTVLERDGVFVAVLEASLLKCMCGADCSYIVHQSIKLAPSFHTAQLLLP